MLSSKTLNLFQISVSIVPECSDPGTIRHGSGTIASSHCTRNPVKLSLHTTRAEEAPLRMTHWEKADGMGEGLKRNTASLDRF